MNFYSNVFTHIDIYTEDTGRGLNMILGRERHHGDAVIWISRPFFGHDIYFSVKQCAVQSRRLLCVECELSTGFDESI